jgi:hypothetical protein
MRPPLQLIEVIRRLPLLRKPEFFARVVPESPSSAELVPGVLFVEIREGYLKWAHLSCPKCGDRIQLPLAGRERWSVHIDFLWRPTVSPSIWERNACGAHFFIKKGKLLWARSAISFKDQAKRH